MSKSKTVLDKIEKKIEKDIEFMFPNLSIRDKKIVKKSFFVKDKDYDSLGDGVKNQLRLWTQLAYDLYENELIKSLKNRK